MKKSSDLEIILIKFIKTEKRPLRGAFRVGVIVSELEDPDESGPNC